jgi:predicted SprT family Zn-dependent metalloprotease
MNLEIAMNRTMSECRQAWDWCPGLPISAEINHRFKVSLARCYPGSYVIRVHPGLLREPDTRIREVLVHELAHLAVYENHGSAVRPHGPEWCNHMLALGLAPNVNLSFPNSRLPGSAASRSGAGYRHRCPVCQFTRYSKRPQRRWRCAACSAAGLAGELVIESLSQSSKEKK